MDVYVYGSGRYIPNTTHVLCVKMGKSSTFHACSHTVAMLDYQKAQEIKQKTLACSSSKKWGTGLDKGI